MKLIKWNSITTGFFLVLLLGVNSCAREESQSPATIMLQPTEISPARLKKTKTPKTVSIMASLTPTVTQDNLDLARTAIIFESLQVGTGLSEYGLIPYPFEETNTILDPSEEFAYCCLVVSPDGNMLAYTKGHMKELVDSVWVMNASNEETIMISSTVSTQGGSNPGATSIVPFGWSLDGDKVFTYAKGNIVAFDLASGEEEILIERPPGAFVEYSAASGKAVFIYPVGQRYLINVVDVNNPEDSMEITAPEEYMPVGGEGMQFNREEVSISSDGQLLAIVSFDREEMKERLWILDLASKEWRDAITKDALWIPEQAHWSPDDKYIAWSSVGEGRAADYYLLIHFLNTSDFQESRTLRVDVENHSPIILGWMGKSTLDTRYGVYIPGEGILLLSPDDQQSDTVLISSDQLEQLLNVHPNDVYSWSWLIDSN